MCSPGREKTTLGEQERLHYPRISGTKFSVQHNGDLWRQFIKNNFINKQAANEGLKGLMLTRPSSFSDLEVMKQAE